MSIVGPRAYLKKELQDQKRKHPQTKALIKDILSVKPGITGPWQTGKRSDTEDYSERRALDEWYVLNCSLWVDIKIILKTIWRIMRPRGAY